MAYTFGRQLLLNSIGFERILDAFEQLESGEAATKAQSYPPYNILKMSDRDYAIEIAIAGFRQDEIEITSEGNKLKIEGKVKATASAEYLHKGIATRDFIHHFNLSETVIVRSADMNNGMLVIQLENVIPEEKQPRKILIGGNTKTLVNEDKRQAVA